MMNAETMTNRQLVNRASMATPTSAGRARPLPEDILRDASRRLGIISLIGAALWVVAPLLGRIASRMTGGADPQTSTTDLIAAASVMFSLALFVYSRRSTCNPRLMLDLGLVYMVLTGMAIGLFFHWTDALSKSMTPTISWIGAVVLMFAAIVPSTPMKTFIAGLIAASMNPLGMLIARARGVWEFDSLSSVLAMHYPDYLLVGVAVVISHVLTKLGGQVAKAREMGSYHLGELLGRGGMGEVYRATHRMLARPAAIKLIRPDMIRAQGEGPEVAVQRFRREAEAAANLRSPHTIELYDFGVTDDQTLYFVMELLDGLDLETLVKRHGPLSPSRTIYIVRQICESLAEAHARGLVHRDIKPANIHVGRLGLQHDFVKVLDFGLVKSLMPGDRQHALATAGGLTPGTPAYMSPEMATGSPVDSRADIYAVGCVTYFLLTGALVFEAANVMQMIAMLLRDEPAPPSSRAAAAIPPALDRLVLSCLAKKPEDRPRSAAEVAQALAQIDVPPWGEEQAAQWWAQHSDDEPPEVVEEAPESMIVTAVKTTTA